MTSAQFCCLVDGVFVYLGGKQKQGPQPVDDPLLFEYYTAFKSTLSGVYDFKLARVHPSLAPTWVLVLFIYGECI